MTAPMALPLALEYACLLRNWGVCDARAREAQEAGDWCRVAMHRDLAERQTFNAEGIVIAWRVADLTDGLHRLAEVRNDCRAWNDKRINWR